MNAKHRKAKAGLFLAVLLSTLPASRGVVGAETSLPMHDITFGGTVVVPSCTVRLDTDTLRFERREAGEAMIQRQQLSLEQCDVEGISLTFSGATLPGQSSRGVLKSERTRAPSTRWHYRVAPELEGPAMPVWPLQLAAGAPALEKDTPIPGSNPEGRYFSLDGATYDYDVSRVPQGGETWHLPFTVSMHATGTGHDEQEDDLTGTFSLQLTYR